MKKALNILLIVLLTLQLCACSASIKNIPIPTETDTPAPTQSDTAPPVTAAATLATLPLPTDTPVITATKKPAGTPTIKPTAKPTAVPTPSPTPIPGSIVSMADAIYSYAEMTNDIDALIDKFPQYLIKRTIGRTTYGRDIPMIIMGDPQNTKKILVQGSTHAREYITSLLIMKQIEVTCEQMKTESYKDKSYEQIIKDCAIYFVPMMNPDGVDISIYGTSYVPDEWKSKIVEINGNGDYKNWKANGAGVDLNGNFGTGFGDMSKLETSPAPDGYPGPTPFSEPESQAIKTLCDNNNFLNVTSYHACGRLIYWYYFQDAATQTRDKQYALELKALTGYSLVSSSDMYTATVGLKDWFIQRYNRPGFTIEVGYGPYGTPVPLKELNNVWNQNRLVPIHLAWREG